jgi:hypothetical protein
MGSVSAVAMTQTSQLEILMYSAIVKKIAKVWKIRTIHALRLQCFLFFVGRRGAAGKLIGHTKLKDTRINKIPEIHTARIQGRVFSEVGKAPQAR